MPQSHCAAYIHLVFSTKYREPYLADPEIRRIMHAYLASTSNNTGYPCLLVGGTEDHVHMLSRQSSVVFISHWIKAVKQSSSKWAKTQKRDLRSFSWQRRYGAFSVSCSGLSALRRYIANQEEHHKHMTFQDEFRILLKKHGLEWDEAYVWD